MRPGYFWSDKFSGYSFGKAFSIGAVDHYVADVINIFYVEADYPWRLGPDLALVLSAQFTDQCGVGNDQPTGSAFDTQVVGGRAALRWAGATLTAAPRSRNGGIPTVANPAMYVSHFMIFAMLLRRGLARGAAPAPGPG